MDTDRNYGAAGQNIAESPDEPYLSRLGHFANRAEDSATRIEEFLGRCRGGGSIGNAAGTPVPMPTGHFAQLSRLGDALDRLDKLAFELGTIG